MSHRLLVKDRRGERELLLIDTITVGRDPRCDISDNDPQLSRRHAEISASDRGVVARDMNSRNGMLVNGRRVLEAVLRPGDVLQVANLAVTFVSAASVPEAVSMPSGPIGRVRVEPGAGPRAGIPPEEDDRTGLMSPDQVAEAAIASLSRRPAVPGDRERPTEDGSSGPGTVAAALEIPAGPEPSSSDTVGPSVVAAIEAPAAASAPPPDHAAPALISPKGVTPPTGPQAIPPRAALRPHPPVPITDAAGSWTASVTWQIGTLAAVSCLIGAASVVPWRAAAGVAPGTAGAEMLLPLVGLLVALGAGFLVAARLRRVALGAFGALASRVRAAADGETARVADPLGTKPTGELAEAINDILARARRP